VSKQEAVKPKPNPLEYTPSTGPWSFGPGTKGSGRCNINTGERNSVLTPGGMGQLVGHRFKFDPADPEQGVFFVAPDGSSSTRVSLMGKNMPGELMFLVPDTLVAGDYLLVVRADFTKEDVRMGTLEATLSDPDGTVADTIVFDTFTPNTSHSRDEAGAWHADWPPSPGAPNLPPGPRPE